MFHSTRPAGRGGSSRCVVRQACTAQHGRGRCAHAGLWIKIAGGTYCSELHERAAAQGDVGWQNCAYMLPHISSSGKYSLASTPRPGTPTIPAGVLPKLRVLQRDLQQQEGDGMVVQDDPWPERREGGGRRLHMSSREAWLRPAGQCTSYKTAV